MSARTTKNLKGSARTVAAEVTPQRPQPSSTSSPESQLPVPSASVPAVQPAEERVDRDNLGRFIRGVSGNQSGRPQGSKNRTSQMKQFIEEAMTLHFSDEVLEIFSKAVEMAKDGDQKMIALLIGDFMKEVRAPDADALAEAKAKQAPGSITLNVTHHHHAGHPAEQTGATLDADFSVLKE